MTHPRLAVSALFAVLAATACGGEPPPDRAAATAAVTGALVPVRDSAVTEVFAAAGIAEPIQRAMVSTRLTARVLEVTAREGDRVSAGQVLARVDASDLDAKREQASAALAAAEASLREAQLHATRMRALFADSAAPRAQLDQAEARLAQAEAGVRQARAAGAEVQAHEDYATLRAPFHGLVVQRMVDPGSFAAPGQPLLVIEDDSKLRISVTAGPHAARSVRRGAALQGTVNGEPVEAVVEGVAPAPSGHVMTVNAIVANPGGVRPAGSAATLSLPLGTRPALLVPMAAVVREGDLTGVYRRRGGEPALTWVRLGPAAGDLIEVVAGLAAGDTVVVRAGAS